MIRLESSSSDCSMGMSFWGKGVNPSYTQRGGSPVALDRILATKLGTYAVEQALQGASGVMTGIIKNELVTTPLKQTWTDRKPLDPYLFELKRIMAR